MIPIRMCALTQSTTMLRTTQRRPTISDVARLANVSIATVSRVVNGSAPVAEETVQQVWRAIDTLNYMPSSAARSLAGRRTGSIGLFLPRTSGAFFASMLQGVETGVRESGFELLIHAHRRSRERLRAPATWQGCRWVSTTPTASWSSPTVSLTMRSTGSTCGVSRRYCFSVRPLRVLRSPASISRTRPVRGNWWIT